MQLAKEEPLNCKLFVITVTAYADFLYNDRQARSKYVVNAVTARVTIYSLKEGILA
jgi:hypothetical protein